MHRQKINNYHAFVMLYNSINRQYLCDVCVWPTTVKNCLFILSALGGGAGRKSSSTERSGSATTTTAATAADILINGTNSLAASLPSMFRCTTDVCKCIEFEYCRLTGTMRNLLIYASTKKKTFYSITMRVVIYYASIWIHREMDIKLFTAIK